MATIEISSDDITAAANFLEQFLSDQVSEGDFSVGTALRDLTIGGIAAVFAYLIKENTLVRNRQSLKTIEDGISDTEEATLREAVVALTSNFFITPKEGKKSRGTALVHLSKRVDVFIQPTHRFTRARGAVFLVDSTSTYVITAAELLPVVDADGVITEWQAEIPVVSLGIGEGFNFSPGVFAAFDRFSPYVTKVDHLEAFTGGKSVETSQELLERAPTAIAVRNLINSRSIETVLKEEFPDIKEVLTVRHGDPEMVRDKLDVAAHLAIHVGGAVDIFTLLDMTDKIYTGVVGELFTRPDNIVNVFLDNTQSFLATGQDFSLLGLQAGDLVTISADAAGTTRDGVYTLIRIRPTATDTIEVEETIPGTATVSANATVGITDSTGLIIRLAPLGITPLVSDTGRNFTNALVGDVLRITAGLPGVPREFRITDKSSDNRRLFISDKLPFDVATDELDAPDDVVSYTIGRSSPGFSDIFNDGGGTAITTGVTSRKVATAGRVTLPGEPIMDIIEVLVTNPDPVGDAAYIDPTDGFVHFDTRVNVAPSATPPGPYEYQYIVNNPLKAQTSQQYAEILINTPGKDWANKTLRVKYKSLAGFSGIDSFVTGVQQRVISASQLIKGHYPARVVYSTSYRTRLDASEAVSATDLSKELVNYILEFNTLVTPLTRYGITRHLLNTFPDLEGFTDDGTADSLQLIITVPSGEILTYDLGLTLDDRIIPIAAAQTGGPALNLSALGMSNRTIRYIAKTEDMTFIPLN